MSILSEALDAVTPTRRPSLRLVDEAAADGRAAPVRGWLTQQHAALYLDISVAKFREVVTVPPKPVGKPQPGKRPLMRYRIADLDAWMESNASYRLPRR